MKFLIAGLGSIGRRHLRNLVALGQSDILLLRTGNSTLPTEELAGFPVVETLEAGLAARPDAVVVCNPTSLHLDVAIPAAEAGCHLLIEKPVSHSMDGLETLRQTVKRSGCHVLVGFQFRFHPTLRRVRALVETATLGRVTAVRAHWGEHLPDWHPWENHRQSYAARRDLGGGALLTLSHPFDYLRWIFGEIEEASGIFGYGMGLPVESEVEAGLRFETGLLASVHLDYLQRAPEHTLDVVAEGGRLRWDGITGTIEIVGRPDGDMQMQALPQGFERNDLFVAEMAHFVETAAGRANPVSSLEDGIQVQRVLAAIQSSARRDE